MTCFRHIASRSMGLASAFALLVILITMAAATLSSAAAQSRLGEFLPGVQPSELYPGAEQFGEIGGDQPSAPILKAGKVVGYAFLNGDLVDSTGYSGKPINVLVALDLSGKITGAKLVEHHEPIVLVGIPVAKIVHFIDGYIGKDVLAPGAAGATPSDIVSGATVTVMVIGDSIVRSSLKIARARGIGGGAAAAEAAPATKKQIDTSKSEVESWETLLGDGSIRRLSLTTKEINEAFKRTGNAAAIARPEKGDPDDRYIDLYVALASVPTIGRSLLGDAVYEQLRSRLKPGQQAILVAGDGVYSFRGSGYVRGGIFDRIELVQGEESVRFRDRDYWRIGSFTADDAPDFPEIGLFVIPERFKLDPAEPWRLQLLVQRATGAMEKAFISFNLGYTTPDKYLQTVAVTPPAAAPSSGTQAGGAAPALSPLDLFDATKNGEGVPLWQRIWRDKLVDISILIVAIAVLTGIFFFQDWLVKRPKLYERVRLSYLAFTLLWLGWYQHAQLSVVNVFTFFNALRGEFRWEHFLMDPLVFILWSSVAVALLFWGRGAFCGWLCPFGALQEWMNWIAKRLHVPQFTVPFGLHQRLWPIKYIIFLVLFGVSLNSLAFAEKMAEIEPFKTAIILHFVRDWWFVAFALLLLAPGLFIERFYCRYMCPLGGALAIPGRMRMFDWLKRYRECGSPCQRCANECPVQSIHPEGHINPNECIQCLNCQVLYHHDQKCPVMIQKRIKREKLSALSSPSMRHIAEGKGKSSQTIGS